MTLAELVTMARARADQRNSTFISDAELGVELNKAYARLWALVVEAHEDYLVAIEEITLVAGTDSYDLAAVVPAVDKLLGVDIDDNGVWRPLQRFQWSERGRFRGGDGSSPLSLRYQMRGGKLVFAVAPAAAFDIRLHYVPCPTTLAGAVGTDNEIAKRGWDAWVAYQGALFLLQAEQSDSRDLRDLCAEIEQKIRDHAANADAEQPQTATMRFTNNLYDEDI